jgi:hypothetical protein
MITLEETRRLVLAWRAAASDDYALSTPGGRRPMRCAFG